MGIIWEIKKEFKFLVEQYGFKKYTTGSGGPHYCVAWVLSDLRIWVYYDYVETPPVCIVLHGRNSLNMVYDGTMFREELKCDAKKEKEKLAYAANWLKNAIAEGTIII